MIKQITDFKGIIDLWPNMKALSDDVNESHNAVRQWRCRNRIPAHMWADILTMAKKRKYPVDCKLLADIAKDNVK